MLPFQSGQTNSVGRYFKTMSGSRDHRSGLYIFDCPKLKLRPRSSKYLPFKWLKRLVEEPHHFRCGFDSILPWFDYLYSANSGVPLWFDHRFYRISIIRIKESDLHLDWLGYVFSIVFQVNNHSAVYGSKHQSLSTTLPHPFYLSFESEYTEECFEMPLNLERGMVDGKYYLWTIYISWDDCHFVKTGAQITFKASQRVIMKEWGLHMLTKKNIEGSEEEITTLRYKYPRKDHPIQVIDNVVESNNKFEPKIQLPYNWLVSDEDEAVIDETKRKEIDLSNLGLLTN